MPRYSMRSQEDEDWQGLNPPYAISRADQRRRFGARRIKGIGSQGTTPSEMAARYRESNPGEIVGDFTPESVWRKLFPSAPTPSLGLEAPADPVAFSSLARETASSAFRPKQSPFAPAESNYMSTPMRGAVDYMRKRRTPITDQLRRNTLGYDPLYAPMKREENYV